jgi:hypothetical protein
MLTVRELHPLMPHDMLAMIMKHLEETGATNKQGKAWDLVVKWCVMAAQKEAQEDSLVLFTVKAVTEGDDSYFEQLVEQQLNATMGMRPMQETLGGMSLTAQSNSVPAQFAAELSKRLAMGLKLLGPLKSPTAAQGGHTNTDTKQGYSNEDIAALISFAHVKHGNQLPTIWEYFNSYRGKSINIVWQKLYARMKQWSHDRGIPIKTSMYLEETTTKALIELKFNPGEGVAHLSSADKGLSIMCCRGCTSTETKRIWECKDALSAT